jgi:hypothetical protein
MNLFHYCSNAAMISIVENKEIWASELALSNDVLEGKWIREVFLNYCKDKEVTALEQNELLNHLDFVIAMAGYAGFCMSEVGDLLSQWRAYADNGAGVSIGFDSVYFEALGNLRRDRNDEFSAHLTKVEYDLAEQKRLVAEHADEILKLVADGALRWPTLLTSEEDKKKWRENFRTMGFRFMFFYFFLFRLKNPAFAEERGWRIISHIFREERDKNFGQLAKMEFRPYVDGIIPFTRIALEPLSQPSITEIVLGPRNLTPERVVGALLLKHGWSNVSVRRSKASYR